MINSNPMFTNVETSSCYVSEDTATYQGITLKTLLLLGITGIAGILSGIFMYKLNSIAIYSVALVISFIVGLVAVIIGRSNPKAAEGAGIIYSLCEGVAIGMITLLADLAYNGIGVIAVATTIVIFVVCLALFASGALRNTNKLRSVAILILCSIVAVSLVLLVLSLFNIAGSQETIKTHMSLLILIEVLYVMYGCTMLFFNFDEAVTYVKSGATKEFEWVAAFGLILSILYIYVEVLRLLIYIMSIMHKD